MTINNMTINNIIENKFRGLLLEIKDVKFCFKTFKNF
jgi:hypothetical protein